MDMSQYMEIFIDESKDHLQHMNTILLDLENNTEDLNLLNEIFRVAHTIKGMSGTMGYNQVASVTHEMENVLHKVRSGEIPVSPAIVDILFECFDMLEEHITSLENTGRESDTDAAPLVSKLQYIVKNNGVEGIPTQEVPSFASKATSSNFMIDIEPLKKVLLLAIEKGVKVYKIRVSLEESCMLKAARAFIIFNTLESNGEILLSMPSAEDIEDENFDQYFELIFLTQEDIEKIQTDIRNVSEVEKVDIVEINADEIQIEKVDAVYASQSTTEQYDNKEINSDVETDGVELENNDASKKTVQNKKQKNDGAKDKAKTSKTVRVDIDRLDNLMNLVSELIIVKTRLEVVDGDAERQGKDDAIEYLERITTSLHDAVMKVRMVPVERTFNRFPRMVRDLSKDLGKNIQLIMSGEDTEVDRTVIDEIGDPLIHLIRNSIDHGIESPQKRQQAGKPEKGTVALRAYPDGNTVVIEVEDDGGGINPDKIVKKALEKQLILEREAENMSQKEILNLLFRAGFSTAQEITDLSGRGVGLDVVKNKIESLNGTVEVESEMGRGSKFIIRLPLTLAIIQALMINIADEKYAIPLNNIKEITTIKRSKINMVQDQEVVLYRDKTLPIIRLNDVLEVNYGSEHEEREDMIVVIVRKGDQEAGLVVDSLIGQQEIVIKSLGRYLTGVKIIAGATILGNGSVALIVDSNQLI